jgi:hypothetical protein
MTAEMSTLAFQHFIARHESGVIKAHGKQWSHGGQHEFCKI